MGDAPQGEKIAKRTRSAVQETAASTRPKRAAKAAGKEPEKPTAKPTAKRAAKFKSTYERFLIDDVRIVTNFLSSGCHY